MVVIAAVDRSDRGSLVVDEAATLASAFGDDLAVIHVMTRSKFVELETDSLEETGKPVDIDRIRRYAESIADEAALGIDREYEAIGRVGDPADEIVKFAENGDARYVVIASRKRSPAGKALFGSVAQSVILSSACPVVSVLSED